MFREDAHVEKIEMLSSGPKFTLKRLCVNSQSSSSIRIIYALRRVTFFYCTQHDLWE